MRLWCTSDLPDVLWGTASVHAESYLIKDANVFAGDDSPAVRQDILIVDGRIESLGTDLAGSEAQTVIDAAGRPLTPAFFAGISCRSQRNRHGL